MIPLRDENPTSRRPIVTIALILACVAVYFFVQPSGSASITGRNANSDTEFTVKNAATPCEVVQGRPLTIDELHRTYDLGDADSCTKNDPSPAGFPHKQVYLAL